MNQISDKEYAKLCMKVRLAKDVFIKAQTELMVVKAQVRRAQGWRTWQKKTGATRNTC
jgi:hypothetical protein